MDSGQPRRDIGLRTRNWCWYWLIKVLTGKSDDALDKAFIEALPGNSLRPRSISRIRGWGTSPAETRGFRKARSIFEVAHALPGLLDFESVHALPERPPYSEACYLFVSPLWELLSTKTISLDRLKAIIESLLHVCDMERLAAWQLGVLERSKAHDGRAMQDALGLSDDALLLPFRLADDTDTLALLIALYKEAVEELELALALKIEEVVLEVVVNLTRKWGFPSPVEDLLTQLVLDRGLRNIWLTETDWAKDTGVALARRNGKKKVSESERKRELNAFVMWLIQRPVQSSLALVRVGLPLSRALYDRTINDQFDYDIPASIP